MEIDPVATERLIGRAPELDDERHYVALTSSEEVGAGLPYVLYEIG